MLISFIFSCFLLAISPGPDNLYIFGITSESGKLSAFSFLLGLMLGCLIHTTLLAAGLTIFISENKNILSFLKYLGFLYLIFLAIKEYISFKQIDFNKKLEKKSGFFKYFKIGLIMNLLNPKVLLFFILFFPNFLFSQNYSFHFQILVLGLIFILISFVVFTIIIYFADFIKKIISTTQSFNIIIKYFNISILLFIAFTILFSN